MLGEWTCPDSHCDHTSKSKTEGAAGQVEMGEAIGDEQGEGEIQIRNRYLHRRLSQ